ncbi:MAG TPA: serine/threonine-protein kinase [Gemmata sp.]|jgi:serine/threonine protein kinase|nr:serine/threonine-protein kinase [Gemmata sp.]
MPPPGNATDFLLVVEKSGLLKEDDLDRYRFQSAADPSPPDRVAKWMMMDGRLTQFQAGLLLAGKSRPFFLGQYKILSRLGNGNMGVVYLCEHNIMSRKVAVKVLQKRRAKDVVALERFLREARASATLDHPNVVRALDFGCENQLHYIVMEYIDGRSLKALVLSDGALQPLKVAGYLRQAALGLQHAHEAGLIHRDVKPSNFMINRTGIVKLLDLGLARFEESDVDLTQGKQLGTMAYAAPEQAKDSHTVDARADIYSLGAAFYLALTGHSPKPGIGIGDAVPPDLEDTINFDRIMAVLRRMTVQAPTERYQSAAEVAAEMDLILSPPPASPEPEPLIEYEAMESDELNTVESLGHSARESTDIELSEPKSMNSYDCKAPENGPVESQEPNEVAPVACSLAASDTVETVESSTLEDETASKPALEKVNHDTPAPSNASPKLFLNPSSPPQPRTRVASPDKKLKRSKWQLAQQWVDQHLIPIILVLAVVVGLLAALANRERSQVSNETNSEAVSKPGSQNAP